MHFIFVPLTLEAALAEEADGVVLVRLAFEPPLLEVDRHAVGIRLLEGPALRDLQLDLL